jgi:hypothetical protein
VKNMPSKNKKPKIQVQRPVKDGPPIKTDAWDGRFRSVEPMKYQKPAKDKPYKWNHHTTINWIMGQADPVGFLTQVMQGKEIFPVYSNSDNGTETVGKISADPELRVMAAKTLLGKCVPDLKAVEVTSTIEERKVLDISRLTDNDLTTIERVLEHAVAQPSESRENEEIVEGVHKELLANN